MAHTPGPWSVDSESGNDGEAEVIVAADRTICWTADTFTDEEGAAITDEDRANARLIAAAPELHEACKHALHALNTAPRFRCGKFNSYDIASMLEHAIAKAEGRITDNAVS